MYAHKMDDTLLVLSLVHHLSLPNENDCFISCVSRIDFNVWRGLVGFLEVKFHIFLAFRARVLHYLSDCLQIC